MWLVQYVLKFRITFYLMSILILLAGIGAYVMMPKDVLPQVNIPVVTVVWTYRSLDTPEMEKRVTTYTEFALSNNVNGIRDMESTTLQGVTITRIYFQPDVSIDLALSQVTASTNSIRAVPPAGIRAAGGDAIFGVVGAGDPAGAELGQGAGADLGRGLGVGWRPAAAEHRRRTASR
ncbi:MAG: efflux RND transporter permease subunit [Rhodopila sp.]